MTPAGRHFHAGGVFFVLMCLITTVHAYEIQDLDSIELCARSFVEAQSPTESGTRHVSIGNLDPRLRLRRCTAPLEAFFPPGAQRGTNMTVGVRCPGENPWTLYVSARITYTGAVLVTTRSLARGAVLQARDLAQVERELGDGPVGFLTEPGGALGMRLKRPVTAGSVLTESLVEQVPIVQRGQRVVLVSEAGSLSVRMTGEALSDAAPGERIRVRNLSSERIVEGTLTADGRVRMGP